MKKSTSGQGFYDGEECFVKYGNGEKKSFDNYEDAKRFYDSINSDKALWQTKPTELIESHP